MPRTRTRSTNQVATVERAPGMLAAARRLSGRPDITKISKSTGRGWQTEAWQFYDVVGEFRYGVDWISAMLSRATLHVTRDGERITTEADDTLASAYLEAFFGGPQVIGQMLREVAVHLTVAGECYIVGVVRDGVEQWHVVAATELTSRGGNYYMWGKKIESDADPMIIRLWRPHPRKWTDATSPARAILPVLSEIDQLTKFVSAQVDSRLAGAGILFIPSEMTLPAAQTAEGEDGQPVAQPAGDATAFVRALGDAMSAALQDRESAESVVPIVVTGPGDVIGNAKHLTFWSELQEQAKELRDEAIRRLGLGMDLPPEVVLGTADTNHWNAWKVDETAIKAHAEPLLGLITESLTTGYLRPLLIADGMEPLEASRYAIESDTANLRLRPDRSQEALELYDRGAISLAALLREVGFDVDDAPSGNEFTQWLIKKVAQGQTTPELVEAAIRALGADISPVTAGPDLQATGPSADLHEARPTPSLEAHPYEGPPRRSTTGPGDAPAIAAAAEVMVYRALERAGNRLRTKLGAKASEGLPACDVYLTAPVRPKDCDVLLSDAFTNLDRYQVCQDGVPPERLEAALDAYCRHLMVTHSRHTSAALQTFLADQLQLVPALEGAR